MNCGLGRVKDLMELKNIPRPLKVKESKTLIDMFWSEKQALGYKGQAYSEVELENFL